MSDHYITLIPEDPRWVPDASRRAVARNRFAAIASGADEIEITVSENVKFFDCGTNFERIICPSCHAELPIKWWQDRMDDDMRENGFKLAQYLTPCCKATFTLHELINELSQGFGRFAIEARNANIGQLDDNDKRELEEILGAPLRVIYRHI